MGDGQVRSFRTVMTGELFALLSARSILRYSVGGYEIEPRAFDEAVDAASAEEHGLCTRLFTLRAGDLVFSGTPAGVGPT